MTKRQKRELQRLVEKEFGFRRNLITLLEESEDEKGALTHIMFETMGYQYQARRLHYTGLWVLEIYDDSRDRHVDEAEAEAAHECAMADSYREEALY